MKAHHSKTIAILTIIGFWMIGCQSIPKNASAVKSFEVEKYMGKWYEIARLDVKFERDLSNITATYSLNKNGTVKVDNQGYNEVKKEWKQAIGKAKFTKAKNIAELKVSFFGPFYSGYNVVAIDEHYNHALVVGESLKYMWLLSRTTTMPDEVKTDYLDKASEIGYDTSKLIWVEHHVKF